MATVVSPYDVARTKNLVFETTQTLRNQIVNVSSVGGDFVIDFNGLIYKTGSSSSNSATVYIVGGLSNFINEKDYRQGMLFLSAPQKRTIAAITRYLAKNYLNASITSSQSDLQDLIGSCYENYKG